MINNLDKSVEMEIFAKEIFRLDYIAKSRGYYDFYGIVFSAPEVGIDKIDELLIV